MYKDVIIDVHSHILPEQYLKAMKAAGINDVEGYPLPHWSLDEHLQMMEENNITRCMISISTPGISFSQGETAAQLARSINEEMRDIKKKHPDKFGVFALLPLPDVTASLQEIAYALDELQLDGIGLYTNYNGVYPGDKELDAVFKELNKRQAIVFIHPTAPPAFNRISHGFPATLLEYPFETTRLVANMLRSDTITRYPDIKMIINHGGGTVPFLASRIVNLLAMQSKQPKEFINRAYQQYRSIYFDLTAATSNGALEALQALMPPDRLLVGFDFPFMPATTILGAEKEINEFFGFNSEERTKIRQGNGLFKR